MSETEKKGITVKIDADLHAQVRQARHTAVWQALSMPISLRKHGTISDFWSAMQWLDCCSRCL